MTSHRRCQAAPPAPHVVQTASTSRDGRHRAGGALPESDVGVIRVSELHGPLAEGTQLVEHAASVSSHAAAVSADGSVCIFGGDRSSHEATRLSDRLLRVRLDSVRWCHLFARSEHYQWVAGHTVRSEVAVTERSLEGGSSSSKW